MLRISEAVIFGSYAQNAETLGDIDFAYRSERKVDIFGSDSQWDLAARDDFYRCGRTAKTMLDELFWPDIKVRLYLKNRQRAISLHCMDEFLAIQRKSRSLFIVLVGDRKSICNDIVNSKLDFEVSC